MLEDALRYPLDSDDRLATLVIGGLLLVFSFLILPAFVLQGYLLRVLRSSANGDAAAPSFTDWGDLLVDGLKLLVVSVIYGVGITIPFVVGAAVIGLGGLTGSDAGLAAFGILGVLVLLVASLVAIVVGYVLPAAITNFALEGSIGAAFDLAAIREAAFSSRYLVGVLLGVVLGGVINTVASPLAFLLVGIPLLFYGQVVTYYCFGRGFAEATGVHGGGDGGVDREDDGDARMTTETL
ncbi:DUF4013 domain-containing protein [Halobaculum sp. CBA1158]|uniref:DUF4013 domain-containing protein n=1 Tax=Halobaculum sp. CBA1158 TaxID=2904243 RepID=UPI001F29A8B2|nr:DUF4013 domain-containing protein [Halobaculum sp. CBA1158]UIO98694.1 DUF4013 domain-containing protein [Halobaculum sp. CBA1158]